MNKGDTVKEVFSLAIFTIKVIHTTMAGCSFETRFKGTVYPKINLHVVPLACSVINPCRLFVAGGVAQFV